MNDSLICVFDFVRWILCISFVFTFLFIYLFIFPDGRPAAGEKDLLH